MSARDDLAAMIGDASEGVLDLSEAQAAADAVLAWLRSQVERATDRGDELWVDPNTHRPEYYSKKRPPTRTMTPLFTLSDTLREAME